MQTDHRVRSFCSLCHLVDVQCRRITGENGAGFCHCIHLAEGLYLHINVFVNRLNNDIGLTQVSKVRGACQQSHALVDLLSRHTTTLHLDVVVTFNHTNATVEGFLVHFQRSDRDAYIQETHGNAATHGAAADHSGAGNFLCCRVSGDIRNFRHLTLGEEHVNQRFPLRVFQTFAETFLLYLNAGVEVAEIYCGFDTLHDHLRREPFAHLTRRVFARVVEQVVVATISSNHSFFVANTSNWAAIGDQVAGVSNRAINDIPLNNLVDNT